MTETEGLNDRLDQVADAFLAMKKPETTKTENLFSTDPDLLMQVTEVNHLPVIGHGTDGNRTFVLCHNRDGGKDRVIGEFVTWSIWRTERGDIAAEHGHYTDRLIDAVIDLAKRVGDIDELRRLRTTMLDALDTTP